MDEESQRSRHGHPEHGRLELGRQNPTLETLLSIADALGVSIVALLQDIEETNEKHKAVAEFRMYLDKYSVREIKFALKVVKAMLENRPK